MQKHKYTTIFSSSVRPLVSEEKDKYLSLASLVDVGNFLPNLDTEKNYDLLPIAFNACVANRANRNGDIIDTKTALEICESFVNKPINIEHNRDKVIGTILTAGFSAFGSDEVITDLDQIRENNGPFNLTLGGVVWKIVNSGITDLIEESNDPTSDNYLKISASWELGFSDYNIVAMEGESKNMEDGEVISEFNAVEKIKNKLRGFGGDGKLEDGRSIYRQVINDVLALGIGLTETPAADVKGVAVKVKEDETEKDLHANESKEEEKISQKSQRDVIKNDDNRTTKAKTMKINRIEDITDESLKELSASTVSDFIQKELEKASEDFSQEKSKTQDALNEAKEKQETLSKENAEISKRLEEFQTKINELESEKEERLQQEKFSVRMASFDEKYKLSDDDRKVLAAQIKDLDDESFDKYSKDMTVLLSSKDKEILADEEEEKVEVDEKKEDSEEKSEEKSEASVIEEAVDKAEEIKEEIPNSSTASAETVYDKYKQAFDIDQFDTIVAGRNL